MRTSSLLLTAASLVLVAPAAAQDGRRDTKPAIREVQMNARPATRGPMGAVIVLRGINFHLCPEGEEDCRHPDVEVEIGGTKCMLLDAGPEQVTFIIPQFGVAAGKKKIKLSIKGKGTAEADFEVVDPQKWQESSDAQAQAGMESNLGSVQPDLEEQIRGTFVISRFELKRDAGANRFEVEGRAGKVPDDFSLMVVLSHESNGRQREVDKRKVQIEKGGFQVIFGPYTKQLLFGNYTVSILFELSKQSRVLARRFTRTLSDPERQVYDRIERRDVLTVGNQQELDDQRTALQNHYLELTRLLETKLGEFEAAYGSACREFFRGNTGPGFDEAEWVKYVKEMGLAATDADVDKLKKDSRFASANGHFRADEYERWITSDWLAKVVKAYQDHQTFTGEYIAALDDRADTYVDYMFSNVLSMFQEWSKAIYERTRLEAPEAVRTLPIRPIAAPTVSKRFFLSQKRLLLRSIGLGNLVTDDDAGQGR